MIMCAKNYKGKFKFVEVIEEKVQTLYFRTWCIITEGYKIVHRSIGLNLVILLSAEFSLIQLTDHRALALPPMH